MRKLTITMLLVFGLVALGNAQSNYLLSATKHELACGDVIKKGTNVVIDTLVVSCFSSLLLQDNATLSIGVVLFEPDGNQTWDDEILRLIYGDVGWGDNPPSDTDILEEIPRVDMDGNTYSDWRYDTDVDPVVTFTTCMPTGVWGDPNVEVVYSEYCPDITLGDDEVVISPENEMLLDCIIWDFNGRILHQGKFEEIFRGDCGVGCLKELFWNKILLIQFQTETGVKIQVKRIYVR